MWLRKAAAHEDRDAKVSLGTYTWDARNRLVSISATDLGGTSLAAFKYDALGRRIERTVTQGASTQRTQYVYDGIQAIGELTDGRLANTILTGLNIDEVIARTVNVSGGQNPVATKSYLTDALGTVLATTTASQNPEIFYSYSAYGETQQLGADPDSPPNSAQYTARENDGLVGGTAGGNLYYYRARYYDPVLKRFISEDPIGLYGSSNTYRYVNGDPAGFRDPLGLQASGQSPHTAWNQCCSDSCCSRGGDFSTDFADAFFDNFLQTNSTVWGLVAPLGSGLLTAGTVAESIGSMTFGQAARFVLTEYVFTPSAFRAGAAIDALGAVSGPVLYTAAVNFVVVGLAYETGVAIGSAGIALKRAFDQQSCRRRANR